MRSHIAGHWNASSLSSAIVSRSFRREGKKILTTTVTAD